MKHDTKNLKDRFAYIETLAWWGDGLTAQKLGEAFGIARQNAQQSIRAYRQRYPRNLRYDPKTRRLVANDGFACHYVKNKANLFLDYLRGLELVARFREETDALEMPFVDVDLHFRHTYHHGVVRAVLSALRNRRAILVLYRGRRSRGWLQLSPHHVVHADSRYHVRAYCHEHGKYGDFVLSRMEDYAPGDGDDWVDNRDDRAWHDLVDVCYRINPHLPEDTQGLLRYEYGADADGCLWLRGVRRACLQYVERRMTRIDPLAQKPLWQRLA